MPFDKITINDVIFDIEIAKLNMPIIGMQYIEAKLMSIEKNYHFQLSEQVNQFLDIVLSRKKNNDRVLYDEVIKRGIFVVCFENHPDFVSIYHPYENLFPRFNPKFELPSFLNKETFKLSLPGRPDNIVASEVIKQNITDPRAIFHQMNDDAPTIHFIDQKNYWIEPIAANSDFRIHFKFFADSDKGNNFHYKITLGKRMESSYRKFSFIQELTFYEGDDKNQYMTVVNKDFIQHVDCKDLKNEANLFTSFIIGGLLKAHSFMTLPNKSNVLTTREIEDIDLCEVPHEEVVIIDQEINEYPGNENGSNSILSENYN